MFEWYYRVHGHHIYEMASTGDAAHNINRSNHASTFEITSEDSIVDFYDLCTVPSTLLRLTTIVAASGVSQLVFNRISVRDIDLLPLLLNCHCHWWKYCFPWIYQNIKQRFTYDGICQIERTSNSWLGSSMLAYLGIVNQLCISKKEYEESVNSILFVC
ncbi:hypothetical protein EDC94DRAFT_695205 [Helicostylum pulchrum]|nr:hypothetical protein EDC94DRAFT_695205 [Helicostylum pulchrum]